MQKKKKKMDVNDHGMYKIIRKNRNNSIESYLT